MADAENDGLQNSGQGRLSVQAMSWLEKRKGVKDPTGLAARALHNQGGLGGSHTAPCGAAVPARPPTRS
jgi:hypothetical protein